MPEDYDSTTDTDARGRDLDDNGIRDDIDVWLAGRFEGQALDRMTLHARLHQMILTEPDGVELSGLFGQIEDNSYCLWSILGADKPAWTRELFARLFNTRLRYERFMQRETSTLTGTVASPILPMTAWASRCGP